MAGFFDLFFFCLFFFKKKKKKSFTVALLPTALFTKDECRDWCALQHAFGAIYIWTKNGLNLVQGTKRGVTPQRACSFKRSRYKKDALEYPEEGIRQFLTQEQQNFYYCFNTKRRRYI